MNSINRVESGSAGNEYKKTPTFCLNEKGAAFLTVVIVISILLAILGVLLTIGTINTRSAKVYSDSIKAQYMAESGAEKAMASILNGTVSDQSMNESQIEWKPGSNSANYFGYKSEYSLNWTIKREQGLRVIYTINSDAVYTKKIFKSVEVKVELINENGQYKLKVLEWK